MMDSNALNKSPRFTNGDSILAPGGSVSNMYALMIARHKLYPQVNLIFWLFLRCGDDAAGGEGINATFDANFGELSFVFSSAQEVRDAGHQRTTDHVHQSAREWHHHHHHRGHHHHHHQVVIIAIINKIVINVILQHHYSIKGGASAIGLGTDNCVQVMCDEK